MNQKRKDYLRQIPAVNDLLADQLAQRLLDNYSRQLVVEGIREITDKLRDQILEGDLEELAQLEIRESSILEKVEQYLEDKTSDQLLTAINATGVVVHTNLGRSLLSEKATKKLQQVASKYSTLEIRRESGARGSRYEIVEELLTELTGAEAALVVNNNASAVLLALSSLAAGQEAIIARGQLVEIGGSFRIPEVMEQGGAKLVEVGATNRVHLADYQRAINEETGLLLKVHTSNYKIEGFNKEVPLEELVSLGEEYDLPVVEDLGSGILVDLTASGLSYEPTVQDSVQAGVNVVTFSGDKLLGGPQAGIIVGAEKYIEQLKSHPLNRALRVDKFTLAALEATLQEYRDLEEAKRKIPTLQMLTASETQLKREAKQLAIKIEEVTGVEFKVSVREDISRAGGGAFPTEELPTYVIELAHPKLSAEKLAENLRLNKPPIFTRIANEKVLLDLRTLQAQDSYYIVNALQKLNF